jgi:twitching motility two-component system response regulator PilH
MTHASPHNRRLRVKRSLSILLIEDSATYALKATAYLEDLGHRVTVADSAERGIEVARAQLPDVILLDIHLPGINGYEAVRVIRNDSALHHTPVVALTNSQPVDKEYIKHGMASGFTGHTEKPQSRDGFEFLLQAYVD